MRGGWVLMFFGWGDYRGLMIGGAREVITCLFFYIAIIWYIILRLDSFMQDKK